MRELAEFIRCPLEAIEGYDVAALNPPSVGGFRCAEGLDEGRMLDWLDKAAQRAQFETRRHWYRFNEAPSTYNNSAAYFCCYFLCKRFGGIRSSVQPRPNPRQQVSGSRVL